MKNGVELECAGCGLKPQETHGWCCEPGETADEYVWREEGTLDASTGKYLCDSCYIQYGQPSGHAGHQPRWTATPANLAKLGITV